MERSIASVVMQIMEYGRSGDRLRATVTEMQREGAESGAFDSASSESAEAPNACVVPTWPLSSPMLQSDSISSLSLRGYIITIPPLQQCVATFVRIRPPPSQRPADWSAVNVDTAPIRAYLHIFTQSDGSGVPCDPDATPDGCKLVSRPLPLVVVRDRNAYALKIVPDSSSVHYVFQFEVRACVVIIG